MWYVMAPGDHRRVTRLAKGLPGHMLAVLQVSSQPRTGAQDQAAITCCDIPAWTAAFHAVMADIKSQDTLTLICVCHPVTPIS